MIHSKKCFKCEQEKPIDQFYKHRGMADGHLNKCKDCAKKDSSMHRTDNLEAVRAYDRERGRTPERVQHATRITKAWRSEDLRRQKCHNAVSKAIKAGILVPQHCEKCDSEKVVAHHEDYDEPLQVNWFCQACHKQHHRDTDT